MAARGSISTPGLDQVITDIAHLSIRFKLHEPMGMLKRLGFSNPLTVGLQPRSKLLSSDRRERGGVDLQVVGQNEAGHGLESVKKTLTGPGHPR